jgi:predicted aminopeptidase
VNEMNSKQSCSDNLCGSLTRTAVWRRGLQAKYANDPRNGKAAATLERLAAETNDLTDEQWTALKPYFNWSSGPWADAVSLASRHVEFQRNVRTFSAYINQLIGILSEQNAAAAS